MSEKLILPIYIFSDISIPSDWKDKILDKDFPEEKIQNVMSQGKLSREKAIYSLLKCGGVEENAIYYWTFMKYNLKFPEPEKGIESIISIPNMLECGVFCANARPVVLTTNAKEYYGVSKIEDMVGKNVGVFRRAKDEFGNYETPYVHYLQKGTIEEIICPWRFDMAEVVVRTGEELTQPIKIERICIDW